MLAASCVALGVQLYQLDDSLRAQVDASKEQKELLLSVQAGLESPKAVLETSQRDLENARSDLARIAQQARRVSGQTRRLDSERVDVAAVVADARLRVVTVHCADARGSGFALDIGETLDGRTAIITNHHVIEACTFVGTDASVSQGDTTLPAELWSWDQVSDLPCCMRMRRSPTSGGTQLRGRGSEVFTPTTRPSRPLSGDPFWPLFLRLILGPARRIWPVGSSNRRSTLMAARRAPRAGDRAAQEDQTRPSRPSSSSSLRSNPGSAVQQPDPCPPRRRCGEDPPHLMDIPDAS